MPALNKQSLINLLIDSPLREAIKINLIDIVNNTTDADLDKTYSTISKELEIYQKATERRLKLAGETIAQLAGTAPAPLAEPAGQSGAAPSDTVSPVAETTTLPPLPPLPPMPAMPPMPQAPVEVPKAPQPQAGQPLADITTDALPPLQVPPLDLPPMPATSTVDGALPPATSGAVPLAEPAGQSGDSDEAALQEIQKELDALKRSAASDISSGPSTLPPVQQM